MALLEWFIIRGKCSFKLQKLSPNYLNAFALRICKHFTLCMYTETAKTGTLAKNTETAKTGTLANREDPDEMQHDAAFHQGRHCLLKLKQSSETERVNVCLDVVLVYKTYNTSMVVQVYAGSSRFLCSKCTFLSHMCYKIGI